MIEILVKYIQDHGFQVIVMPGVLRMCKRVGDEFCSMSWCIPKHDLRPDFEEVLYYQAQGKMDMIDRAIAEKVGNA